jgi:hypothetical protein
MTDKKTSSKKKLAKLKVPKAAADASIMIPCCSGAIDLSFPNSTFTAKTSAKSLRISSDTHEFHIVGLPASAVDRTTKPWRIFVRKGE